MTSDPADASLPSAVLALARANMRYWPSVSPLTARELRRWQQRAVAIPDASLRGLALCKLSDERFNAQVAATLTTLAPRPQRPATVTAIVALEVAYDYLDGLTERPADEPLAHNRRLFATFTGALRSASQDEPTGHGAQPEPAIDDGGYLDALAGVVRDELGSLPAWPTMSLLAQPAGARTAEAQCRLHAAPVVGDNQLKEWAQPLAACNGLGWREFLAGAAASVLACHALIVAAADPATSTIDAERLDAFYLRACALSTLLDAIVDRDSDRAAGAGSLLRFYPDAGQLSDALCSLARDARSFAEDLPDGSHHLMILTGVVAYYASAAEARGRFARPILEPLRRELSPLIFPTLAVMRSWRAAKRLRALTSGAGS